MPEIRPKLFLSFFEFIVKLDLTQYIAPNILVLEGRHYPGGLLTEEDQSPKWP